MNLVPLQTSTHAILAILIKPADLYQLKIASHPQQAKAFSPKQMAYVPQRRGDQLVGENERATVSGLKIFFKNCFFTFPLLFHFGRAGIYRNIIRVTAGDILSTFVASKV